MGRNPTEIGSVQDVTGAAASVALNADTVSGTVFVDGHGYRIGQVGAFVRIPMGYVDLFGVVSQVGAGAVPASLADTEPYGHRWMTVQLVGEGNRRGEFVRGLSQYPTIGDAVHLVTQGDLRRIYGQEEGIQLVKIGTLASASAIPAFVNVNTLVTRHSAVVGSTGAGKTTAVVQLLSALSGDDFPSARVLVLDIHGEYATALGDRSAIFRISPSGGEQPLCIPYWALTYDELVPLMFGALDDAGRASVLDAVTELKRKALEKNQLAGVDPAYLTVDTPVPFSVHQLWFSLHKLLYATHTQSGGQSENTEALTRDGSGEPIDRGDAVSVRPPRYLPHTQASGAEKIFLSNTPLNIRRQVDSLASKLRDPRYDFVFRPGAWLPELDGGVESDLDSLLQSWIGGERAISILDLSGVPSEILTTLVGALLRLIYDALFWARNVSEGGRERPLLVVMEEAHTYLAGAQGSPASLAVRRIVKEGRKYGIGAMLVSQRPAEVDATVLSQCGTVFAMRLNNTTDRGHIAGAISDNLQGLLDMLPTLRTGEAVVFGEAVRLPIRTLVDLPPVGRRPDSADPDVADKWSSRRVPSDYKDVVSLWRRKRVRSDRVVDTINRKRVEDREEQA